MKTIRIIAIGALLIASNTTLATGITTEQSAKLCSQESILSIAQALAGESCDTVNDGYIRQAKEQAGCCQAAPELLEAKSIASAQCDDVSAAVNLRIQLSC